MGGFRGKVSRREFLAGTAASIGAFTFVPASVLGADGGQSANERLNIAAIGSGGMGASNIRNCSGENIVALCDVDDERAADTYKAYPGVPKFKDFRKMLEKEGKRIDAVIVATPDHVHAVAAMAAMEMGKHVYVQKPLTRTVWEARKLTETARRYGVVTQMGNQGHSSEGIRLTREWIQAGVIGEVREVHCWTNRPIWPQGIDRPEETPAVPDTLDWKLWLGPAPARPYHPAYVPFNWRGWWDFGTGALGDMGCHIIDDSFWALDLKYPTRVSAVTTDVNEETAPTASIVTYEFSARGSMPAVTLRWYDGNLRPPKPAELGRDMGRNGTLFVGSKCKMLYQHGGGAPRLIPESRMRGFEPPAKTIRRVPGGAEGHEKDWIRACKQGGEMPSSNFDYSGPLTETVVMGNLAIRAGKGIEWDGENMKVTNIDEANKYVKPDYRAGWSL